MSTDTKKQRERLTARERFNKGLSEVIKALEMRKQEFYDNENIAQLGEIVDVIKCLKAGDYAKVPLNTLIGFFDGKEGDQGNG